MSKMEVFSALFGNLFTNYNFEFPIHLVMVGINGTFLNAKFNPRCIILAASAEDLRFPANCMFVDGKGDAAHVLISLSGEPSEITLLKDKYKIFS